MDFEIAKRLRNRELAGIGRSEEGNQSAAVVDPVRLCPNLYTTFGSTDARGWKGSRTEDRSILPKSNCIGVRNPHRLIRRSMEGVQTGV